MLSSPTLPTELQASTAIPTIADKGMDDFNSKRV